MSAVHSLARVLITGAAGVLLAAALGAQAQNPLHLITHVQATPAGAVTVEDLVRTHVLPGVKQAGTPLYTWRIQVLGSEHRYAFVAPIDSMSRLDSPPGWVTAIGPARTARFYSQVRQHVSSLRREIHIDRPDLSFYPRGQFDWQRALLVEVTLKPGMQTQMEKMLKEQLAPAFKEMKRGFASSQVGIGGNPNQWIILIEIEKFADLDGGPFLLRHWGPEKYAAWSQAIAQIVSSDVQYSVAELVPGLSVMPPE